MREVKNQPQKLQSRRERIIQLEDKCEAIEDTTTTMLARNQPIFNLHQVQRAVKDQAGLDVDGRLCSKVMSKDLGLGYRRARTVPIQSNSERCLVLRQQYALKMLPLLEQGRRIINIDESWLNQTRFHRKLWVPSDAAATLSDK